MRIFSGIQPTGQKHLGNYSGGFRQYVATQDEGDAFFCIVDLHSITVEYEPEALRHSTLDLAAMLFAVGLDPERSTVFCQSHVPAHPEAAWLLAAVTSFGQLQRMTQFKGKAATSSLIEIMSVATGESFAEIESRYDGQGYGPFKTDVAEAVVSLLDPIRLRYEKLRGDPVELQRLLARGAEKARNASQPTLDRMYDVMGFVKVEAGRFFGAARPRGL